MIYTPLSFSTHSTFTVFLDLLNFCFCVILVLIAYSCAAIIKASVIPFKHPFLSHLHQSSLALLIVFLINCSSNCFYIYCVFLSFFFLFLYSLVFLYLHLLLLYMQQLRISLCCFFHNFFTPKLLSPLYLGFQSILCLHLLIDTINWSTLLLTYVFIS